MKNVLLFFMLCILAIPQAFALDVEAFPKGGIFDNPRVIGFKSDDSEAKIMWTRNPDGSPDETFVYEMPVPIHYTQEIWFFAFNDKMEATPFKKEIYIIRANPNRYSKSIYISEYSPQEDWLILKNNGSTSVKLKNWSISSRHGNIQLEDRIILGAGETYKVDIALGDVLDRIDLKSPDHYRKDFFEYKIRSGSEQNSFERMEKEWRILK